MMMNKQAWCICALSGKDYSEIHFVTKAVGCVDYAAGNVVEEHCCTFFIAAIKGG